MQPTVNQQTRLLFLLLALLCSCAHTDRCSYDESSDQATSVMVPRDDDDDDDVVPCLNVVALIKIDVFIAAAASSSARTVTAAFRPHSESTYLLGIG